VEAMETAGLFSGPKKKHPGPDGFHLALVPGSRRQEVEHLLPRMIEAYSLLRQRFPGMRATVSRYHGLPESLFSCCRRDESIAVVSGPLCAILGRADCAMVTSGTATLEAALLGIPHIIAYHTSAITYTIGKMLIGVPYIGLPNILAGEAIVPECIQEGAAAANLALALGRFIESPELYESTVGKLIALRERLGEKRASEEVCGIIQKTGGWR
jgi:lipid-A-disaccharide synthase